MFAKQGCEKFMQEAPGLCPLMFAMERERLVFAGLLKG